MNQKASSFNTQDANENLEESRSLCIKYQAPGINHRASRAKESTMTNWRKKTFDDKFQLSR